MSFAKTALVQRRMLANSSSNVLRTTRRFCAAGSRFEWQTLPSGLRIKHVRLAAHGGLGRPPEGCCPCSTQVSDGNQGDEPVGDNQTIRVTYSTRLVRVETTRLLAGIPGMFTRFHTECIATAEHHPS